MPDDLTNLLHLVDDAAGVPPRGVDVAARVRRRRVRRRRTMSSVGAAAVMVVVLAGVWAFASREKQQPVVAIAVQPAPKSIDVAQVRREAEQLSREADLHDAALALFTKRAAEQQRQPRPAPRESRDVLADLRWQRERAAIVLVRQGDRLAQDLKLPEHAAVAYRQARDTFPGTRWGSVAEARLSIGQ